MLFHSLGSNGFFPRIAIISVEEQLSAWYTLRRRVKGREALARVYDRFFTFNVRFLSGLSILPFTEPAVDHYERLIRLKLGVKGNDLRIASIAKHAGATAVTRNKRDFGCIPELKCENWSV